MFVFQKFKVEQIYVHEEFMFTNTKQYDIAVIILADKLYSDTNLDERIRAVCLPVPVREAQFGELKDCVASGWGSTGKYLKKYMAPSHGANEPNRFDLQVHYVFFFRSSLGF